MADSALIVGSLEDEHVQAVLTAMGSLAPLVFDASRLELDEFVLDDGCFVVGTGDRLDRLRLAGARGWVRRLSPPGWRIGAIGGSRDAAVRGAWIALTLGIASNVDVDWLTPYPRLIGAENKLRQARHANRLGIRVPRTVVASRPEAIPDDFGDEFVVKPLGAGHFIQADGEARVLWAQTLRRGDERLAALRGAPFLVQEQIPARRHLRVVTVKDRVWSCELLADDLPLDWRRSDDAHHAFRTTREPTVEEAARRLAIDMGLGYSSQDWIDTGEDAVFIDLNPAGQWLFLPEPVNDAVADAIADHLRGA